MTKLRDENLEGVVRCVCGCKYWDDLRCHSCGEPADLKRAKRDLQMGDTR